MATSTISEQAKSYARVIVGQIADNFVLLEESVKSCDKLHTVLGEYKKAKEQGKISKFFFNRNIDEYTAHVKSVEEKEGISLCDGYNTIEPLAVGLFGEWGSGKTHQLKLIKQNILYPPKDIKFPKTTIPVFFNAWRFEKEEHIIIPLFQTLLKSVEDAEFRLAEKAKKSFKTAKLYLKLALLSLYKGLKVPNFKKFGKNISQAEYAEAIKEIFDGSKVAESVNKEIDKELIGGREIDELLKPEQLESIYLNIPAWIEKITLFEDINFVFLIDDLDRCLPENTLKMLESIKLFLDVPSCAFVLAVDDDVVERGVIHHYRDYLSIYHNKDTISAQSVMQEQLPITGHEYLEKMIQLPIRLPVVDTTNAKEFLRIHSQKWIDIVDSMSKTSIEGHEVIKKSLKNYLIFLLRLCLQNHESL